MYLRPASVVLAMVLLLLAGVLSVASRAAYAQPAPPTSQIGSDAPAGSPAATQRSGSGVESRGLLAGRQPGAAGTPSTVSGGPLTALWIWMRNTQQRLHQSLAGAVRDLKTRDPFSAALALMTISFLYGVFHAAGPGHGKAVISSYVLANERTVRRGIMLSFLAAGVQGLSALVLVAILALVLNATGMTIKATEGWIETLSWALVAAVGAWLLYGQVKILLRERAANADGGIDAHTHHGQDATHGGHHDVHTSAHQHAHASDAACGCGHDGAHHHEHAEAGALLKQVSLGGARLARTSSAAPTAAPMSEAAATIHPTSHDHGHDHHGDCCGHAHMPSPDQLGDDLTWAKALAIAFSVGIRPCTGAILVLLFALSQGMLWAGVMSTFAMAIGTAITVSALAALAVGSREMAKRLAGGGGSRWGWRIERAAGLVGALLVLGLGTAFFLASLQPQTPF